MAVSVPGSVETLSVCCSIYDTLYVALSISGVLTMCHVQCMALCHALCVAIYHALNMSLCHTVYVALFISRYVRDPVCVTLCT